MASADREFNRFNRIAEIPPLRGEPFEPDGFDDTRAEWLNAVWDSQTELLRQRDRQVEENLRMLLGQQWVAWSDMRGRFVNLADELSDEEKKWRHMPVLNRLFLWFVLTHSRMTENPPVLAWQPGPDRIDSQLAEVMDPIFKHLWRRTGMLEVLDRAIAWMIPCGRVYLKSRIDPDKGDPIPMVGEATLSLLGPNGEPTVSRTLDDVPHDAQGNPLAALADDGRVTGLDAQPHIFHEGGISVDVLTCLEVRGEWGAHVPWHEKAWHMQRSFLTPLQAFEEFGIEIEPDVRGDEAENVGILWRVLHGSGLFGAAEQRTEWNNVGAREFVTVYERWQRPGRYPGTQRTQDSPGGRLTITTGGGLTIRDGVMPCRFDYTSPMRVLDFINLPGRPSGSSPQEQMNGPVRTRNRLYAQGIAHATQVANPVRIADADQGMEEGHIPNVPGAGVVVSRGGRRTPALEYVSPPALGEEVYESADRLVAEIDQIGSVSGTEGSTPTQSASGELVEQLRFNADRPIGSTMKRMVYALGRMAEDWRCVLPVIWDEEKIISVVGDDQIPRTIAVMPELLRDGNVDVEPVVESMLPEGRQERQARVRQMYADGIFGEPGTPVAVNAFLDLGRFPHLSRAYRPGGVDRSMAAQNVGKLLQGAEAVEISVFEWYDHAIHLLVLEQFMKSPEFLKQDVTVMEQMVVYRALLQEGQAHAMMNALGRELAIEAAAQATSQTLALGMPTPPGTEEGAPEPAGSAAPAA